MTRRIPIPIRSAFRFFGFSIGNGNVRPEINQPLNYDEQLEQHLSLFLPSVVAVFMNSIDLGNLKTFGPAERRVGQYVLTRLEPDTVLETPIGDRELKWQHLGDYRRDFCQFASELANTLLPPVVSDGGDWWLSGSGIELLFAVYTNVSELDDSLRVKNHEFACQRVFVLLNTEETALAQWETELW